MDGTHGHMDAGLRMRIAMIQRWRFPRTEYTSTVDTITSGNTLTSISC